MLESKTQYFMNLKFNEEKNCLTLTMCGQKVHIVIWCGKAPEGNLKGRDNSRQDNLDQRVQPVTPPPAQTNLEPLSGPDVVQHHLEQDLHEGNQQAVDHPDIHHLHTGGLW